jgi:squalene-associated FAD-dependent desaturase
MRPRVAIVGGGLAGLATAVALAGEDLHVSLFEARRRLGGRSASYDDPASGALIDHCQHVSLACCTNFSDFCRRTGVDASFRRDKSLTIVTADGREYHIEASNLLPAPFHWTPALWRLSFFTWRERISVVRAMWRLIRLGNRDESTMREWLAKNRQSASLINRFWEVILTSALGETIDRVSVRAGRKVFVDGFLATPWASQVLVPLTPLADLMDRAKDWLLRRGAEVFTSSPVERITGTTSAVGGVALATGDLLLFDYVVAAVPWRSVRRLFSTELLQALPELKRVEEIESSPITGIHLWSDRPLTPLPHAILVDSLSQWVFRPSFGRRSNEDREHYYQVVISASKDVKNIPREDLATRVFEELKSIWPGSRDAKLLRWQAITEQHAVFSVRPGIDACRPPQQMRIGNLFLAGDWTATGWPSTMEGAVRSGYLAAEAVCRSTGCIRKFIVRDPPRSILARWLLGPPA